MTQREDNLRRAQQSAPAEESHASDSLSESSGDRTVHHPHSLTTPPPDPAEALYYEGMAAYQHRNWEDALERFSRLRELQPTRPGLDALLDEVRWFQQLQETAPGNRAHPGDLLDGSAVPRDGAGAARANPRPRWQTVGMALLALVGVLALLLIAFQGRLPWANASGRETQELYNRGQARLAVGDYEGAQAAFKRLLEISPNDPEAKLGLARADRQQTMAQDYAAAEAAIAEENWDAAATELDKILKIDSSYADAQAKADFVAQRRRLAALYDDGSRLYDLGQWQEAITQFEKIRELDNSYRTEAVTEFLFVCYLNAGQTLIDGADGKVTPVTEAIEYFSRALAIHPRNRPAADARRLGSLYLDAVKALAEDNPAEAQSRFELLLNESPTYAGGQAARQLYALVLNRAQASLDSGDIPASIRFYQQAEAVPVSDHTAATQGEALARAITPTPTAAPSSTAAPTVPPATATPYVLVRSGSLNLREGPGTAYPVLGQLAAGQPVGITGKTADGSWLRVCCVAGRPGWVAANLVEVQGALEGLAVVTPAPLPTAAVATRPPPPPAQLLCVSGLVRDAGTQQPLAGWTVLLQTGSGPPQTLQTDRNGAFKFSDLSAATYTVSEQVEVGWRAISPQSSTITVAPATDCVSNDFWNEKSSAPASTPAPTATPLPAPTPTPPR